MTDYGQTTKKTGESTSYTDAIRKLYLAYSAKRKTLDEMDNDFEFALGKQYDADDMAEAEETQAKKLLTFNQIAPVIQLFAGLESQNRSDYRAFPQGKEDSLEAEAVTKLHKHVMDVSDGNYKLAETVIDGVTVGEGHIEPYLDYTESLINGEMKFRAGKWFEWFFDPKSREYDHSDAQYCVKLTPDLTREELLQLYPDKEAAIRQAGSGKLNFDKLESRFRGSIQKEDYPEDENINPDEDSNVWRADLAEIYYKKLVARYPVIDLRKNEYKEFSKKEDAEAYIAQAQQEEIDAAIEAQIMEAQKQGIVLPPEQIEIIRQTVTMSAGDTMAATAHKKRLIPEIWLCAVIGGMKKPLYEGPAWSYKRDPKDPESPVKWKRFPVISFYARKRFGRLKSKNDQHLLTQGVTRQLKSSNWAFNKLMTQQVHHLNASVNSGFEYEEGSLTPKQLDAYKRFGSRPGVMLARMAGKPKPERIIPTPLATGHLQLATEIREEAQRSSGIDAQALAMDSGSQSSGRAIALRQRQAMVMVQEIFDNLARTKKILAKFILSQFAEIFDVETAMRVMGEAWIKENFMAPRLDPMTGQPVLGPDGQLILEFNEQSEAMAREFFNNLLNNAELGKYDVAIGESISSETLQMAYFMDLQEMNEKFPGAVPPDVLFEYANIPEGAKKKIIQRLQAVPALPGNPGGAGSAGNPGNPLTPNQPGRAALPVPA